MADNPDELLMKNLAKRYTDEIRRFFREEFFYIHDREKGHVWIAGRTRIFQVLTVEPPEGGQYEIAVRFPLHANHPDANGKYSGYKAVEGIIVGVNTDGH